MLKKKVNIKGLRKKVLHLEYKTNLVACSNTKTPKLKCSEANTLNDKTKLTTLVDRGSENLNYRILLLRNEPIKLSSSIVSSNLDVKLNSKRIKKNILKKIFVNLNLDCETQANWLKCKYIYWMTPDAVSLKEQLIQLNLLKSYIRSEPKDAFVGCLLETRFSNVTSLNPSEANFQTSQSTYKYYYPSQILRLCDSIDKLSVNSSKSTGLEILGQLLQTIESSITSMSTILALKNLKLETEKTSANSHPKGEL